MDEKVLTAIITQLGQISAAINKLTERVEQNTVDLSEFVERFEEIMARIENERRLDWQNDFN